MEKQESQFIVQFDKTMEEIQQIVTEVENTDLSDIEKVKESHKVLQKLRTSIEKQEKELVSEANAYKTKVFDKRKEYLAITVPVEDKLKQILVDEEKRKILEARKELLPMKKQQLSLLKYSVEVDDDFLLSLDDTQWISFYNARTEEHNINVQKEEKAKQEKIEQEEREKREKIEKEKAEKELAEKQAKEKIELAKKQERERIEKEAKDKQELAEKQEREAKEKAEKEARDKELQEAKIEADRKFQEFLTQNKFSEETDKIEHSENEVKIYRLVAVFKKK